jgi:hypothetical protein
MGGIIGGLLGRHHAEQVHNQRATAEWTMRMLGDYMEGKSDMPTETAATMLKGIRKYIPDDMYETMDASLSAKGKQNDLVKRQQMLTSSQPDSGTPAIPAGGTPPMGITPSQTGFMRQASPGVVGVDPNAAAQAQQAPPPTGFDLSGTAAPPPQKMGSPPPLPAGPDGQQQQTGPVSTPKTLADLGQSTAATGFGGPQIQPEARWANPAPATPPTAPAGLMAQLPTADQVEGLRYTPESLGRRKAARDMPLYTQQKTADTQAALDLTRRNYEQRKELLASDPAYQHLTDREKLSFLTGQNVTPEPHYNIPGVTQSQPGMVDMNGAPIKPGTAIRIASANGKTFGVPVEASLRVGKETQRDGTVKNVAYDQYTGITTDGRHISEIEGFNPMFAPQVTSSSGTTLQNIPVGNTVVQIPSPHSNETKTQRVAAPPAGAPARALPPPPGASAAPAAGTAAAPPRPPVNTPKGPVAAPAPTPAAAPAAGTPNGLPAGSRIIGETPASYKLRMENQYTPAGQKTMEELQPRMLMVKRLLDELKPYKNDDTPATELLPYLSYRFGRAGDQGDFLSQLSLSSIGQAGNAIKGMSKAVKLFNEAQIHTPIAWKDSRKNMYQKMSLIYKNMQDSADAVNTWERTNPGLTVPGSAPAFNSSLTPPPGPALVPPPPAARKPLTDILGGR